MPPPHNLLDLSPDEVLTTTRSVRKRLDLNRSVPRELITEILNIAVQAPNGSNMQMWHWVFIDDKEVIGKVAKIYGEAMDAYIASLGENVNENYLAAERPRFNEISTSVSYLKEHLHQVPMILIPLMEGRLEKADTFTQASQWGSVIQAVWSFMLALRVRGLGSAWTTVHLHHEQQMAELLSIPYRKYTQVGLFPVAYTVGTDFKPGWRLSNDKIFSWNSFSSKN